MKYISERYQSGLSKVNEFCSKKLKTVVQEDFDAAQHVILTQSAGMGIQNPFPAFCMIKDCKENNLFLILFFFDRYFGTGSFYFYHSKVLPLCSTG